MTMHDALPDNTWKTATYCGPNGGNCVEVNLGGAPGVVGIRDTKPEASPVLVFGDASWGAFLAVTRTGTGPTARGL